VAIRHNEGARGPARRIDAATAERAPVFNEIVCVCCKDMSASRGKKPKVRPQPDARFCAL
jgi:hypothetical protein